MAMTVERLISHLECEKPDATVMVAIDDSDGCHITKIEFDGSIICLVGESKN